MTTEIYVGGGKFATEHDAAEFLDEMGYYDYAEQLETESRNDTEFDFNLSPNHFVSANSPSVTYLAGRTFVYSEETEKEQLAKKEWEKIQQQKEDYRLMRIAEAIARHTSPATKYQRVTKG